MSEAKPTYDPGAIEPARQAAWAETHAHDTPSPDAGRAAVYVKPSSPFTMRPEFGSAVPGAILALQL